MGAAMKEPTLEAVLVSAADLVEIRGFMVEIRQQNTTMMSEIRQNQKTWEERHDAHERRLGRLERQIKWLVLLALLCGFATGWRWRGEQTAQGPQIIYQVPGHQP